MCIRDRDRLVELLRPGGLLITDNVLWDGEVVPGFKNPPRRKATDTRAISEYNTRINRHPQLMTVVVPLRDGVAISCLLYTSDAADERSSVDLGGRRIIKKKKKSNKTQP